MKIGIFIEPPKNKSCFLYKWKNYVKKQFGNQKYLTHPLHLTIAVFNLKKKIKFDFYKSLTDDIKLPSKFKIYITKPKIFYNDELTKGDTLFFEIKKNSKLINLQQKILNHFNKIDKYIYRNQFFKNKNFQSNYKKFGFPFIGSDWIPHFTIASIKDKSKNKNLILKKFLSEKNFHKNLEVNNFSIWQIKKDQHKKLIEFRLK